MSVSNWNPNQNRFARAKIQGTVRNFQTARGFVVIAVVSNGIEGTFIGLDNGNFTGIETGDFLNLNINYVFETTSNWMALGEFVEMVDILDKSNAQQWVYNSVTYTRNTLQEALRITRNEGRSGRTYNFWIRDIDFVFAGGYFLLRTGTTELGAVEYYGEDLSSTMGHGGVLINIDCTGILPKVIAIRFFEYPSRR